MKISLLAGLIFGLFGTIGASSIFLSQAHASEGCVAKWLGLEGIRICGSSEVVRIQKYYRACAKRPECVKLRLALGKSDPREYADQRYRNQPRKQRRKPSEKMARVQRSKENTSLISRKGKKQKFVYLGDSLSAWPGGMFSQLKDHILRRGTFVSGQAICGAGITAYLKGKFKGCRLKSPKYLEIQRGSFKFRSSRGRSKTFEKVIPMGTDVTVVQLGGNHIGSSDKKIIDLATQAASRILKRSEKCIWIGPPSLKHPNMKKPGRGASRARRQRYEKCMHVYNNRRRVNRALNQAFLKYKAKHGRTCQLIDSFALTVKDSPRVGGDCRHYSPKGSKHWAKKILGPFVEQLR